MTKNKTEQNKNHEVNVKLQSGYASYEHRLRDQQDCGEEEILAPGVSPLKVPITPCLPPIQLWFECEVADVKVQASCWCCWEMVTSQ